ncbi:MAG: amidohydrolase family protein [Firmicutes bacterium]|nr:amidohydrolase family protein [Bacillota bacterium]
MRIIDVHTHIFPQKLVSPATKSISVFYDGIPMQHQGSVQELLETGEKFNVKYFLVFTCATTTHQVRSINDFIIRSTAGDPRLLPAGTLHKGFDDFSQELERLSRAGVKGIKLHPDFQKFNLDDEAMFPVYEEMGQRGMFLITHAGDYRYPYSHPQRIARIAKLFPKLRCIAAHCGGWKHWDEARALLPPLENVYIDTSSTVGFGAYEAQKLALSAFDPSHIFFGTDFPMWDYQQELEALEALRLPPQFLEDILYNNFAAFYGLPL